MSHTIRWIFTVQFIVLCYGLGSRCLYAATLDVYPGQSIQKTISGAREYDTIRVHAGEYRERAIGITKPLTLIAVGSVVIDAQNRDGNILDIQAHHVIVRGFTLKNVGLSYISDNAAIKIEQSRFCTVENCTIDRGFFGIYLAKSAHCQIVNNTLRASGQFESSSGNGIHLWRCDFITVAYNTITGHRDGIYFEFVKNGTITHNHSEKNLRYGLHFMFSDTCTYRFNTFRRNGAGVAVMYTKVVTMTNNRFEYNWGASAYGLLFKDITDSYVAGNIFLKNSTGLHAEGTNRTLLENNDFLDNGWAVKIMASCLDNTFQNNNFIGNSFDISTNSSQNYNSFTGNYWSRYQGYDLNRDGIGDIPYRPVRFFSLILEQQTAALVLLHSLFVDMLDVAERIIPSMTPETLIDKRPQMNKRP